MTESTCMYIFNCDKKGYFEHCELVNITFGFKRLNCAIFFYFKL